jgi:hypothetical protein
VEWPGARCRSCGGEVGLVRTGTPLLPEPELDRAVARRDGTAVGGGQAGVPGGAWLEAQTGIACGTREGVSRTPDLQVKRKPARGAVHRISTYRRLCRDSDVVSRLGALPRTTITNMIDFALFDEQSRLVQLDDEIPKAAVTALLPFRGIW